LKDIAVITSYSHEAEPGVEITAEMMNKVIYNKNLDY
jgi:hypothetical protein